jgi:serine/threonine protein kinase
MMSRHGGHLREPAAALVALHLLAALAELHARGVAHLHIKPEHILLAAKAPAPPAWKLIDFSDAVEERRRRLTYRAGTMEYMAPEVLAKPTISEAFHQVRPATACGPWRCCAQALWCGSQYISSSTKAFAVRQCLI